MRLWRAAYDNGDRRPRGALMRGADGRGQGRIAVDALRFDALVRSVARRPNRRRVLGTLAGLGLGGVLLGSTARPAAAIVVKCVQIQCLPNQCANCTVDTGEDGKRKNCHCKCETCTESGIGGGGAVDTGSGEAQVALLATRTQLPGQPATYAIRGQVHWTDPAWEGAGLTLESTVVVDYEPLPGVEGGREAAGWMRTGQAPGEYPFVLRAIDAGPAGSGQDTVALWVGDAVLDGQVAGSFDPTPDPSGFRYQAEGTLVSGALHLLSLAAPTAASATTTPESSRA